MKKTLLLILIIALLTSMAGFAAEDQYLDYAEKLQVINVFKGTGNGFELDRPPTRLEGGVMFVRLLGAEQEALDNNYPHPFTDVPAWGNPYVGYMYHYGLTNGISATEFGSVNKIQAKSYLTFTLRALDYDDGTGDFTWNEAVQKSLQLGLIDSTLAADLNSQQFLRDHVAKISYDTLRQSLKDGSMSLAQRLVNKEAFQLSVAMQIGVISQENSASGWILTNTVKTIPTEATYTPGYYTYNDIYAEVENHFEITNKVKASTSDNWEYTMKIHYTADAMPTSLQSGDLFNIGISMYSEENNLYTIFPGTKSSFEIRFNNTLLVGESGEMTYFAWADELLEGTTLADRYITTINSDLVTQGEDFIISIIMGGNLNVQYDYYYSCNE